MVPIYMADGADGGLSEEGAIVCLGWAEGSLGRDPEWSRPPTRVDRAETQGSVLCSSNQKMQLLMSISLLVVFVLHRHFYKLN
jgi:hypothetical protein